MKQKNLLLLLSILSILILINGCEEDTPTKDDNNTNTDKEVIADFDYLADVYEAPCEVTFTNKSQNANNYDWDFGDGTTKSTEISPIHTFDEAGTFDITLTAYDKDGNGQLKKKSITIAEGSRASSEEVSYYEPNANNLIAYEKTGETDFSFWSVKRNQEGSLFFNGIKAGDETIGKIDLQGNILWSKKMHFYPTRIIPVEETTGILENSLLVVGRLEEGDDDIRGMIALYDKNGNLLSDVMYDEYPKVFIRNATHSVYSLQELKNDLTNKGVSLTGDYINLDKHHLYIASGGMGSGSDIMPIAIFFTISENTGKINKQLPAGFTGQNIIVFSDKEKYRLNELIAITNDKIKTEPTTGKIDVSGKLIASTYSKNNKNETNMGSIAKLNQDMNITYTANNGSLTSLSIQPALSFDFITDITAESSVYNTWLNSICIDDNANIYGVGGRDSEKENNPSGGGYWNSGLAIKVNFDGTIAWKKEVNLSNHNDGFNDCKIFNNKLYACGKYGGFMFSESKNSFGYGLLAEIDLTAGIVLSSYYFGNKNNESAFNSLEVVENAIYPVGYTGADNDSDADYKSWFVKLNNLSKKKSQKVIQSIKIPMRLCDSKTNNFLDLK